MGQPLKESDLPKLAAYLIQQLNQDENWSLAPPDQLRQKVYALLGQFCTITGLTIDKATVERLIQDIYDDVTGYRLLQSLLDDTSISEIMINGPHQVYVERRGKPELSTVQFGNDAQVIRLIQRIAAPLGRQINRKFPLLDARLSDGSRVNAVVPPIAIDGPSLTIRKFAKDRLGMDELIQYGTLTPESAEVLKACVKARLNILISGGTGSGKTTLLNILSSYIPDTERIVTIEDAAELRLRQAHVVRLETRPEIPGSDESPVSIRDLVKNALRMRPDRIIVGECRGGESLDMLQAMNTGHDGSLTTLHANTPRDALSRLETMVLMSGFELPVRVIRSQIASAVQLIVQVSRLRDGSRRVTHITEVAGMEGDTVTLTDIFKFDADATGPDGKQTGLLRPSGIRPQFEPRLEKIGFKMTPEMLGLTVSGLGDSNRRGHLRR